MKRMLGSKLFLGYDLKKILYLVYIISKLKKMVDFLYV